MKAVIVYYSYSGNNESLARELRLRLGCDIVKLEEKKRRTGLTIMLDLLFKRETKIQEPDIYLEDFKTVIFISPIWDAKIATPLSSYLKRERENIRSYSFISVCGGRPGQKEKITDQLRELVGKKPITVMELAVRELLPSDQRNNIKFVTSYRLKEEDFLVFRNAIRDFVNTVFSYLSNLAEKKPQMKVLNRS